MNSVRELLKSVEKNPKDFKSYIKLGEYYLKKKNYAKALEYFNKAVELKPNYADSYNNIGLCYLREKKLDDAIKYFEKAAEINPKLVDAYKSLSDIYFLKGETSLALDYYDKWYKITGPKFKKPECTGKDIAYKRVFVHCDEKDIGKAIMFSRFLPDLKRLAYGIDVMFKPPKVVEKLFSLGDVEAKIISHKANRKDIKFDEHISLLKIPKILGIDFDDFMSFSSSGYLEAEKKEIKKYKKKFFDNGKFKVGIFWEGKDKKTNRSFSELNNFVQFANIPDVNFYSFQKLKTKEQINIIKKIPNFIDLSSKVKDWFDIANAISNLNLVITVDNDFAHLAAAFGIPVWLILFDENEFCWQIERIDSPWYYNILIFRQCEDESKEEVFYRIKKHLSDFLDKKFFKDPFLNLNAGLISEKMDWEVSIDYYKKALKIIKINPSIPLAFIYNKLSKAYCIVNNNYPIALKYSDKAIKYYQKNFEAYIQKGNALMQFKKYKEAIESFQKALNVKISSDILYCITWCYLMQKDFKNGFKYYEGRKYGHKNILSPHHHINTKKTWKGEDLSQKTIWIFPEQGHGDSLQFVRYLYPLSKIAKKIIFNPYSNMIDLFKDSNIPAKILYDEPDFKDYDYKCALMSLPYMLNATVDNIPCTDKYLYVNKQKVQRFKEKYFDNDCFKIGVKWLGNPNGMEERVAELKDFYPLAKIPNVKLYSLQVGEGSEQLKNVPKDIEIINPCKKVVDFSTTAAIIENLDLVITIDTGVAHLAAAMGKPTWIMLPFNPEWRWFIDDDRSPWYESVKLFRQDGFGCNWKKVINKICKTVKNSII